MDSPQEKVSGWANALALLAGLGLGVTLLLTISSQSFDALSGKGEALIFASRLLGMVAAYTMLLLVLISARVPWLERAVGQPELVKWHRKIGPWPIFAISAHALLATLGYAQQADEGFLAQIWAFIVHYEGMLAGFLALVMIVTAGTLSYRKIRSKLKYETWWAVHLYMYLALGLAFIHQVEGGVTFVGHDMSKLWWTTLWVCAAVIVILTRVCLPALRTRKYRLKIESVEVIAPAVVEVVCRGRKLSSLKVQGGQFFNLRILKRGMWWQAHPYSVSSVPDDDRLRFTIKTDGDYGRLVGSLSAGTSVAIEGPYGTFGNRVHNSNQVLFLGAGVGVVPLKAILDQLPENVVTTFVNRATSEGQLVHKLEIRRKVAERGEYAVLHELVGPRQQQRFDSTRLASLVAQPEHTDIYVCGPQSFIDDVVTAATAIGVPKSLIHTEEFAF